MSLADPVRGFLGYTAMLTPVESTMRATRHCRTGNAAIRGRAVVCAGTLAMNRNTGVGRDIGGSSM